MSFYFVVSRAIVSSMARFIKPFIDSELSSACFFIFSFSPLGIAIFILSYALALYLSFARLRAAVYLFTAKISPHIY